MGNKDKSLKKALLRKRKKIKKNDGMFGSKKRKLNDTDFGQSRTTEEPEYRESSSLKLFELTSVAPNVAANNEKPADKKSFVTEPEQEQKFCPSVNGRRIIDNKNNR